MDAEHDKCKEDANMRSKSFFPNLKELIKINLKISIANQNKKIHAENGSCQNIGSNNNIEIKATQQEGCNIELSSLEKKILLLFAEGRRAVPALDEDGYVEQVSFYPGENKIDCAAPDTLAAVRSLLRYGLIAEDRSTGKQEYAITEKGRSVANQRT